MGIGGFRARRRRPCLLESGGVLDLDLEKGFHLVSIDGLPLESGELNRVPGGGVVLTKGCGRIPGGDGVFLTKGCGRVLERSFDFPLDSDRVLDCRRDLGNSSGDTERMRDLDRDLPSG